MTDEEPFRIECRDPLCMLCRRADAYPYGYCEAFFPDRIPREIWNGEFDHTKPCPKSEEYPEGDRGLQFEE